MRYPIFKLHFLLIAVDLSHLLPKDTENMSTDAHNVFDLHRFPYRD
jgi:hypothetical protein